MWAVLAQRTLVMELLHRYSVLKDRMIAQRFGSLDEGLVSGAPRMIREKIETESEDRKWFPDLTQANDLSQDLRAGRYGPKC
jgi:hypothetical protein